MVDSRSKEPPLLQWVRKINNQRLALSAARDWETHRVMAGEYPFLVAGCGRSGTHFLAKYLNLHGIDIGHEETAPMGCIGWLCTAQQYCDDRGAVFAKAAHQIRHPLRFIRSWQTVNPRAWHYIDRYAPQCRHPDTNVAAARYWLHWNNMALQRSVLTVRIEDFDETPEETAAALSEFFGRELDPGRLPEARAAKDSRRLHSDYGHGVKLDALKRGCEETYDGMARLADKFGYRLYDQES